MADKKLRKSIVICYHSSDFGGVENHILDIVRGVSYDADIYVACPDGDLVKEYMAAGAVQHIDLSPRSEMDIGYVMKLSRFLKDNRIDVVHGHELKTGVLSMVAGVIARTPKRIYHVHTSFTQWQYGFLKRYPAMLINTIANFIAGNFLATDVIALTESVKEVRIKRELISAKKIRVIPNGIYNEKYVRDTEGRKSVRESFGINDEQIVVGNIARFTREKGQIDLVNASALITDPTIKFVLAGGGEMLQEMQSLSDKLYLGERVFFSGRFDDKDKIKMYSAFDVFVFPSRAEGFGIALVEAMAMGLPIIASDLPVLHDVAGDTAYYYTPEEIKDLSTKITDLAANPKLRSEMGAKSLEKSKEYSMDKFVRAYADLYGV